MKIYLYLFAITCFLSTSSFNYTEIDDQILVFSKVLEIEAVQNVISEYDYTIDVNGMLSHEIEAFIDDRPIALVDATSVNVTDPLKIKRYDIQSTAARVLITKPNVKVRVKLIKNEGAWEINSYYVKNGKNISISVDF